MFVLIVIFQYRIIHREAFQQILLTDYSDINKMLLTMNSQTTASCMQVEGKAVPMLDQFTTTPL
jgi:hypothetical protein